MFQGMINAVANDKPRFLSILDKALTVIFKENKDIYLTVKVNDILFDGIPIDCKVKDFSATAVCSQLKLQPTIIEVEKNIFYFSLFGSVRLCNANIIGFECNLQRNGTLHSRIKVLRGSRTAADVGRVVSINNKSDLDIWPDEKCNEFRGTDGWIFPSFLEKDEGIWTVAPELCRSVKALFVKDQKYQGISVREYTADFGDMSSNPEEKCYCPSPDNCLPKGMIDLTKCLQVPIYVSLPHFLKADESLLEQVGGLKPDEDKHVIKLLFEPVSKMMKII